MGSARVLLATSRLIAVAVMVCAMASGVFAILGGLDDATAPMPSTMLCIALLAAAAALSNASRAQSRAISAALAEGAGFVALFNLVTLGLFAGGLDGLAGIPGADDHPVAPGTVLCLVAAAVALWIRQKTVFVADAIALFGLSTSLGVLFLRQLNDGATPLPGFAQTSWQSALLLMLLFGVMLILPHRRSEEIELPLDPITPKPLGPPGEELPK
ncbi:hypothetical protein [Histidinibacterium aquaticum]|uniref:Uncharacterized protein n=1 Tax=Histidinibacterium aquaticum TaxID=2613962 RepID=A0A5J5GKI7_9RHOB|nr:hypothetical protein [Histidinibacterium aquaticum]KAA9008715.1 hypothetical protein F3S47_05465 [Histidinibacterium aquaticum]